MLAGVVNVRFCLVEFIVAVNRDVSNDDGVAALVAFSLVKLEVVLIVAVVTFGGANVVFCASEALLAEVDVLLPEGVRTADLVVARVALGLEDVLKLNHVVLYVGNAVGVVLNAV